MRDFTLNAANETFSEQERSGYLVIKEPNGSVGATLSKAVIHSARHCARTDP